MSDAGTTDPVGKAILDLVELDDINDHISMRAILGALIEGERERCATIADEHPDSESCRGDPELVRGCCEVIAGEIRAGR